MRTRRPIALRVLAFVLILIAVAPTARAQPHPLTMDDVLDLERIDRVALSPDREWAAVVVQRAARPGEVYGRTYYDLDPSRGDVWLISRRTGERRNLTQGRAAAAGFWCPIWSPDGSRLAMLSTRPEGGEPLGGDNVRLYVWTRATGALARLSDSAMMTQTMGGSPMYRVDLRGGADGSTVAHRCSGEENAPFLWLDARRILAVTLPPGGVSGLIDVHSRPMHHAADTLGALREGVEPTVTAVGSGAARVPTGDPGRVANVRTLDVGTGDAATVATVPIYPFRDELTLSVAPDGRRIAVLATSGAIQPRRGERIPHRDDGWSVEKRLGFIDLAPGGSLRWSPLPPEARLPLDLQDWSPDARRIALRARAGATADGTRLFLASSDRLSVEPAGSGTMAIGNWPAGSDSTERPVFWLDDRRLLARSVQADGRADWWLIAPGAEPVNLTAGMAEPPGELRRSSEGGFVTLAGGRLLALEVAARRFDPVSAAAPLPGSSIVGPADPGRATAALLVATAEEGGGQRIRRIALARGAGESGQGVVLPPAAQLLDVDPAGGLIWWHDPTLTGLHLREASLAGGGPRDLLSINRHLAAVDWGRTMLVDYRGADGQALKAALILPPGYRPGRRYPVIAWVYPGYRVSGLDDYFLDPYLGGIYNLRLYAARGYVVAIPSVPVRREGPRIDLLRDVPNGVLPALDRLVELGIADPARLGVMGQSFGGYGVYSLVAQTRRFNAAVAMAGFTDFTSFYTQFDGAARGYPGIEHEKSYNWSLIESRPMALGVPPYEDHDLYWRNSPLALVDRVETPLLLIHGEQDARAPMAQAESFFYSLYRQGRTARLLRYWGENHGLSQSPANVRSVFDETVRWFDTYLGEARPASGQPAAQ